MTENMELQSNAVFASPNTSPDNLEDSMWRLSVQNNHEEGDAQQNPYPARPGEPDCIHYLKTGTCSYGSNCRYNHPTFIGQDAQYGSELPQRVGQPDCQYFLKTRTCKFGATCKYHHPQDKVDAPPVRLNILGLPMRQDEKSCPFYMRNGSCKFGVFCKFNHPQPPTPGAVYPIRGPSTYVSPGPSISVAPPGLPLIGGFSAWPLSRPPPYISNPHMQGVPAYMPIVLPPSQGTPPVQQGWFAYPGTVSDAQNSSLNHPHLGSSNPVSLPDYKPHQPECQHYMRTGSCRYGATCKYNHPMERTLLPPSSKLENLALPQRLVCPAYSMYGSCSYGSACRYDHTPMGYYYDNGLQLHFPGQRNSQLVWTTTAVAPISKDQSSANWVAESEPNDDPQGPDPHSESETAVASESPSHHHSH